MAEIKRTANGEELRDIEEDLTRYSEVETIFNRVLAGFLAWSGEDDFGKKLATGIWNRAFQSLAPEFNEMTIHREFKLVEETGAAVWPDIARC